MEEHRDTPERPNPRAVAEFDQALAELLAAGYVEKFRDQHGTVRLRPTKKGLAQAEELMRERAA